MYHFDLKISIRIIFLTFRSSISCPARMEGDINSRNSSAHLPSLLASFLCSDTVQFSGGWNIYSRYFNNRIKTRIFTKNGSLLSFLVGVTHSIRTLKNPLIKPYLVQLFVKSCWDILLCYIMVIKNNLFLVFFSVDPVSSPVVRLHKFNAQPDHLWCSAQEINYPLQSRIRFFKQNLWTKCRCLFRIIRFNNLKCRFQCLSWF